MWSRVVDLGRKKIWIVCMRFQTVLREAERESCHVFTEAENRREDWEEERMPLGKQRSAVRIKKKEKQNTIRAGILWKEQKKSTQSRSFSLQESGSGLLYRAAEQDVHSAFHASSTHA